MAILLISDEVPEVYFNCDRVLHMRDGRIAGEFVPGAASEAQLCGGALCVASRRWSSGGPRRRWPRRSSSPALIFSLSSPYFLTLPNFVNLIEAYSVTTILAAGVFVVLVSGGIDISFTATAAATQYLAATLATQLRLCRWCRRCCARRCLGIALGSVNALLTYYLRVVSIIVTIATSSIYYALLIYFTDAHEIYNLPDWWAEPVVLFRYVTPLRRRRADRTADRGHGAWSLLCTHLLMSRTRLGRQVYAFGGNPEAASRIGINILGVQLFAYGYLGFLAAVAGFIQAYRVHQAVPTAMAGQELNVLAVAILGGASLVGGVGTMGGVVLGVLFLAILQNGLNLLGVSSYFFGVVTGLAILVSIAMTGYAEKRSRRPQHGAGGLMERLRFPTHKRRLLAGDADRLIGWMRRGTVGLGGLLALLALLVGLFLAGRADDIPARDDAAGDDVPAAGARPAVAGDGDPADLRRHQSRDHRHRQPGGTADGLDPDRADAARRGRGGARLWLLGALAAGLVLCVVVGLVTGLLVAVLGVHPILVTLGTMTLLHGISIYFTRGRTLSGFPEPLIAVSNETIFGIPISFVLFALVAAAVHIFLTRTPLGDPHPHDRLQPRGDALLRRRHAPRAGLGLSAFQPALLAGGGGDDGALQLGRRRHRPVLPADHHPRRDPRRHRPLWRLRSHRSACSWR